MGCRLLLGLDPAKEIQFPGRVNPQACGLVIQLGRMEHSRYGTHIRYHLAHIVRHLSPDIGTAGIQPGKAFSFADAQLGPGFFHPGSPGL